MALRREDVELAGLSGFDGPNEADAAVLAFPTRVVRARVARQRRASLARRRLAAGAVVISLTAGFLLAGGPGATSIASRGGAPRAVVVQPGQTLWDLADRYAPETVDPRAYIDAIQELNGLEGGPSAGARLKLPR